MFQNGTQTVERNGNGFFHNGKENTMFGGVSGNIPLESSYGNVAHGHGTGHVTSNLHPSQFQPSDLYNSYGTGTGAELTTQSPLAGLNISNPRYSAMYRNTALRYSPTESLPTRSAPAAPAYPGHISARPVQHQSSPYHTLQPSQHQQYIQAQDGLTNGRLATHV